jgi:hypothetical protein
MLKNIQHNNAVAKEWMENTNRNLIVFATSQNPSNTRTLSF